MKRNDLIREITRAASARGLTFDLVRSDGNHDVYRCGTAQTSIPRHRELGPKLTFEIKKDMEPALGPRWWR